MLKRPLPPAVLLAAAALPPLVAYHRPPAPSLYEHLAALACWGLVLVLWAREAPGWRSGLKSPAVLALALLLVAPAISVAWRGLPPSLGLTDVAVIGAALAVLLLAQGLAGRAREHAADALFWGLLVAGLANIAVSLIQVFAPQWVDGDWIAPSGLPGTAMGNLRQPNHLASLMMWTAVAAVFLTEKRRWYALLPALLLACVFTVVLSASRTGYIGIAMLAAWALVDRRLSRSARRSLLVTPLMLGLSWWAMSQWSAESGHAFRAAARLSEGAGSPSRLSILHDTWALIQANPWLGVGWGEFNFAWSLTPFPNRHTAFFNHTHNLPAQLAVELGLPWAVAVLILLGWALWKVWRGAARAGDDTPLRRAVLMMLLTIGLHSLLEYPLWYTYFLLPACFALGLAMPVDGGSAPTEVAAFAGPWSWFGSLLIAGSLFAVWDYQRITTIFIPSDSASTLVERIKRGQRSLLFGYMADYAAAVDLPPGPFALAAARRTALSLTEARLLMHWSRSLQATGDLEGARFLADRLREFRNPIGDEWFAVCAKAVTAMPQCLPASEMRDWRSFR